MLCKRLFAALTIALLSLWVSSCAINPVTGKRDFVLMSEQQEIAIGKQYHGEILKQYSVYDDPALQRYVSRIGSELALKSHRRDLIFRFTVLDSPQVNAFALPGGYIYITRGIMAYLNSEAELAGVLGHEIGHVTARHGVRQQSAAAATNVLAAVVATRSGSDSVSGLTQILGGALLSGYGREHELESDRLGAEYLAKTGYAANEMIGVVGVLKDQEVFATQRAKAEGREPQSYHGVFASHPRNDKRLQEVIAAAKKFQAPATRPANRDTYLKMTNNMVFGQGVKQGVIRQNSFYHPDLGIALTPPKNWRVENLPDRLIMVNKQQSAYIQITTETLNKRETPKQYLKRVLNNPSSQANKSFNVNGLAAHTLVTEAETDVGKRLARYTAIFKDNSAYVFIGLVKDNQLMPQFDKIFLNTANSFHNITNKERQLAKPYKIALYKTKAGDTYAKLAKQTAFPDYQEARLRLINAQYPSGEPKPGTTIKLVK